MHELGVVFHIMDSLEEVAKENDVTQIQSVTIEIGEVSTVIPHYLTDCWEWAIKKKPLLTGCEMKVEILPAVTWCDGCRQEYPTVQHGRICPYCGSEKTWLIRIAMNVCRDIRRTRWFRHVDLRRAMEDLPQGMTAALSWVVRPSRNS